MGRNLKSEPVCVINNFLFCQNITSFQEKQHAFSQKETCVLVFLFHKQIADFVFSLLSKSPTPIRILPFQGPRPRFPGPFANRNHSTCVSPQQNVYYCYFRKIKHVFGDVCWKSNSALFALSSFLCWLCNHAPFTRTFFSGQYDPPSIWPLLVGVPLPTNRRGGLKTP